MDKAAVVKVARVQVGCHQNNCFCAGHASGRQAALRAGRRGSFWLAGLGFHFCSRARGNSCPGLGADWSQDFHTTSNAVFRLS